MPHKNILKRRICQRNYYATHKEYRKHKCAYVKNWQAQNKDRRRLHKLKMRHGLDLEGYNVLFNDQNGKCAICGKHQSELKKALFVDHCHKTGKVRGLLCFQCNVGIGNLGDDIENLRCAILYLNKNA